ncbi:cation:proton antiporter [Candidatus Woesearchaeota archaeon]|nr:cation:proton antiporter [Candidatus Woesearchaeota archaeon]
MVGVASNIFWQLGLIVIIAAIAAYLLRLIKQPQILAYVLVGILITPVFKVITDTTIIQSMSIIGIAFLLFIVGLEMDIKALRSVALVSALGGAIQIVLLFVTCFLLALFLGFLPLEAIYLGLLFSFSSTMVVMKLLSDKRELNTLHGRIVIGILLLEDILAILALSILSSINSFSPSIFSFALIKFVSLFALAYLASKYLFPRIFKFSAQHQELLLLTSLAVCFLFSLAFQFLDFSLAIGAFVAGISLGNLEYRTEIAGKVKSLRDFFALLFFVSLGMGISLETIKHIWKPLIVFLIVILMFKPFLTILICSLFKFTKRPSFLTAISLAQVGEFSLIIAAQGLTLGHISQNTFSLVILLTLITITLTSYFIKYDDKLYNFLQQPLKFFDIFTTEGLEYLPSQAKPKIILCGHNRIGYSLLKNFESVKKKVLVIDYNPEVISMLVKKGYHSLYGDVADEEIIERMNLKNINMLISTVPDIRDNFLLIRKIREINKRATIIVTASEIDEALRLYSHGASYVIMPHFLGGEHVAKMIMAIKEQKIEIKKEKQRHLAELRERKEIGQEHPSDG